MTFNRPPTPCPRPMLAATLALATLAGCADLPALVKTANTAIAASNATATGKTTLPSAATPNAPAATSTQNPKPKTQNPVVTFAAPETLKVVTPTTAVDTANEARALAANDEAMIEAASAALGEAEARTAYGLAAGRGGMSARAFAGQGFLGCGEAEGPVVLDAGRQVRIPRVRRTAPAPVLVNVVLIVPQVTIQLEQRQRQAVKQRQTLAAERPAYGEDQDAICKVLDNQPWQPNNDDGDTVLKTGTSTLKTAAGASRKVRVLRVVSKLRPHFLVQGLTDLAEVKADGSSKAVHWERTLAADGSCRTAYHHEVTCPDGRSWVTSWEKTTRADGRIHGKGTFTACDADGEVVSEEEITIGGSDEAGQTVACEEIPAPTPTPTATPTPVATATPCEGCAVTGGGQLTGSRYAFGFGPQVVTINDTGGNGVELKADVTGIVCDGTTATVTGTLRAPGIGTVTLVVTDNGEGTGAPDDLVTFKVGGTVIAAGAVSNGQPGGGNIQVRGGCD